MKDVQSCIICRLVAALQCELTAQWNVLAFGINGNTICLIAFLAKLLRHVRVMFADIRRGGDNDTRSVRRFLSVSTRPRGEQPEVQEADTSRCRQHRKC